MRPTRCSVCDELIAVDEPAPEIHALITETVVGRRITVRGPGRALHPRAPLERKYETLETRGTPACFVTSSRRWGRNLGRPRHARRTEAMTIRPARPCACCGYLTVAEEYDICAVCGWEADNVQ